MIKKNQVIFTSRPEFKKIAMEEFKKIVLSSEFVEWLDDKAGIMESNHNFKEIANLFKKCNPIFIRHICPIDVKVELNENANDIKNITDLVTSHFLNLIDNKMTFSVQTRILSEIKDTKIKPYYINKSLSDLIEKSGAELNVSNPCQILSIVYGIGFVYIGFSLAVDNISNWAGGEHRFARDENQISRSEFKLLEALDFFKIKFLKKGLALDLGTAPGGWARILRQQYNMRVIAVDPANLHPAIVKDKKVKHIKKTSQKFLNNNKNMFDAIVNDMKTDFDISVEIMCKASKFLNKNGIGIMTLKLPKIQKENIKQIIPFAEKSLTKFYNLIGIKQLFHNRHEVTIVLSKKD